MESKVGVVGLGNMGGGIARNFQKANVPLAVWDVAPAACSVFAGVPGVDIASPGEMADAVLFSFFFSSRAAIFSSSSSMISNWWGRIEWAGSDRRRS